MLTLNIITELRTIFRNYWLAAITLILITICLYAGWNGQNHVNRHEDSIVAALEEMQSADELMAARLDSIDQGLEIGLPTWQYPNSPTATGDGAPRVAAFPPGNLALISTGQSDMFNHYVKPTLTGDSFSIGFTELSSPVSLLMGNFDPAFVLVYLLPLIIISFCYNILSSEKEHGSLVLVASSPLSVRHWLLQKIAVRFVVLILILTICLLLMLMMNGVMINTDALLMILMVWLYAAFWFAMAYFINLRGKSSARNAITLLGLWVALVLAIPSLISQSASTFYPVPSRALLVNEMRNIQAELDKQQNEILDDYLRNHPELITRDADESTAYGWWQRFFASKDLVSERMAPLLANYDQSLKKQQHWVNQLSFLSPAIVFRNSLDHMAETSTAHYDNYRQSVMTFADEWRDFFLPMVFQDKLFTKDMIAELPAFDMERSGLKSPVSTNATILLVMVAGLMLASLVMNRVGETEHLMQG
ncbi:MAG: DUF3526 domain-containing protein [Roseivirga sp.]|nr:DUF3526 domain-containing protein [Roseivirga sp.]